MQKFLITHRRQSWVALLALLFILTACVAQLPMIEPETADTTVAVPPTEADDTTIVTDSDGSASVAVERERAASAVETSNTLIGGAALPSTETYKGLPVGFTEEGFVYRGDPDAPIVMIEYIDYGCPFCKRHFIQTEPAIDESYVRTGQVRVIFQDFPLVSLHPNAPAAHEAGLCVAAQGSPTTFWNIRAELYRSVDEWQTAPDPLPIFARLAEGVGVDMELYEACMTSREKASIVQERVDAAFARGFNATPSFQFVRTNDEAVFEVIGAQSYEQFAGIIDAAFAGETPVAATPTVEQPPDEGIPFWATAEGWQPDPDRPGYNMAGDQYRGNIDAPVTVIEFSDFQCPFCLRHYTETQPILDEKYVDTGKVLWIFKHFPLNIHPQAPAAGIASECAAEQGMFWEMHDAIFDRTEQWAIDDPTEVFKSMAAELGLDGDAFASCLVDPEIAERVNSDMAAGAQFVQGTPTFIVVRGSQGSIIPGALPEPSFSEVLDKELAAAGVTQ